MNKAWLVKALLIGLIFVILLVPLNMINGVVSERAGRQQAVLQEIASSNYGKQVFAGPILSVPYLEEYEESVSEGRIKKIEKRSVQRNVYFFPAKNETVGAATVGTKSRGLFHVRVFDWQATATGEFVLDGKVVLERSREHSRISWEKPRISLALSDPRGLIASPALQWGLYR